MRFYEWAKFIITQKVNVFFRGFTGFSIATGIFLFGTSTNGLSITKLILIYLLKLVAVVVSGCFGGFATVMGNDMYQWAKAKFVNRKQRIKKKQNKKAA